MRILKFFGSIWFTIILISLSAIFVFAGTLIESKYGSHKIASRLIYGSPYFALLLAGYFINILFALYKRSPLTKRQIPFVLTHIGLLMVIAGAMMKFLFGVQGYLVVKEGQETDEIFLSDTLGVSLKKRGETKWSSQPLHALKVTTQSPHGEEKLQSWIHGQHLLLMGHPQLPLNTPSVIELGGEMWQVLAVNDTSHLDKLTMKPSLVFLQEEGKILAVAIDINGQVTHETYEPEKLTSLYSYDDGFLGYSHAFKFNGHEIESPIKPIIRPLPEPLKAEDERPCAIVHINNEPCPLIFRSPLAKPVNNGNYLARLEPLRHKLPYPVRLRSAKALLYPNSSQPEHYEASLYIDNVPVLISMNNVYEKDGYRFYLSNMTPHNESQIKEVTITVSNPSYGRWLLYPGAIILAVGILLLFFGPQLQRSKK